ncbi:lysylphosphatidylglycerol synthase transmembrane domain-containing protein [Alteribacillus sp. JSM 102045]|uniref:lysylphosphatidylglycerol synthase transmembrane domain-containing protein n=1 Tax=Alteribacillus sp. JSM 102045 TaxID=1562101 RepID=UPI0035C05D67
MLEHEIKNGMDMSEKKKNWRQIIRFSVRLLISLAACLFLVFYIDWREFVSYISQANIGFLVVAFLAAHLCIWISGYKWYILCREGEDLHFFTCLKWYYIGFFFNNFLPGSIGGDGVRMYLAGKQIGAANSIASVTTERVFAGIALFIIMTIGLLSMNQTGTFLFEVIFLFSLCVLTYSLLFNEQISSYLKRKLGKNAAAFYNVIHTHKKGKLFLELICFSLAFQVCFVWITDLLYRSMGVTIPFWSQLAFVSLISVLTMIPISINGLGIREGSYAYLFTLVGVGESVSVAVSLLFFGMVLAVTSVGGIFYLFERGR